METWDWYTRRLHRVRFFAWVAALSCCFASAAGLADDNRSGFQVSAQVEPVARLVRISGPEMIVVTTQDVDRRYKNVALRYSVWTNDRQGTVLRLTPLLGLTESIEVRGLAQALILTEQPIDMYSMDPEIELEVRLNLRGDAVAGTYQLPLHLSATTFPPAVVNFSR